MWVYMYILYVCVYLFVYAYVDVMFMHALGMHRAGEGADLVVDTAPSP